jgi:hypothetical protein
MDCFVAALLAMTSGGIPAARFRVRAIQFGVPLERKRAQGMPGAGRTRRLVCKNNRTHTSSQVRPKRSGTPCAMALRLTPCSPRGSGLFSPRRLPDSSSAKLDPSVGGSGPHGLAVRMVPHVLRHHASIATRLTSGDEWPSRPPYRGGLTSLNHKFAISERAIFLRGALDASGKTGGVFLVFCPSCRGGGNTAADEPAEAENCRRLSLSPRQAPERKLIRSLTRRFFRRDKFGARNCPQISGMRGL